MSNHFKWVMCAVAAAACFAPVGAQQPAADSGRAYTVFLQQRAVGQETLQITRTADGLMLRGSNRLGPPLDVVMRNAEIHYTSDWRPIRFVLEGTARGDAVAITTTFANGQASSEITVAGKTETKVDQVTPDTLVLPNAFLGSYAALARRLTGAAAGAAFRAYVAPQGEVPLRLEGVFAERIETPRETIAATRYALLVSNPPPAGDTPISIWTDAQGELLRLSVPSQTLELAREDIASAATRTTAFSIPGDESVSIPAAGFNLAASFAKPAAATAPLPAVVLVGGLNATDRDGMVNGVPLIGQLAAQLVEAGFAVVRFDRRGVGQSGGRAETATLGDYAEDVRAVVAWLDRHRDDVDDNRIAVVGDSEGAWVALRAAERDDRIRAVGLINAGSLTGAEMVLEQQQQMLAASNASPSEQESKIALQRRINDAALKGSGWDDIPAGLRSLADTPWFQSYLSFDPARVLRDVHQPVIIVRGGGAGRLAPSHAERLAEIGRTRRRNPPLEVVNDAAAIGGWLAANLK